MLPPGFKPVDLPVEKRKAIFRGRPPHPRLAVQEANQKLPMDDEHMPKGDAYAERIAEHKAIIDGILEKNLPALAERNQISMADLDKIEEEARMLRWTPPEEPKLEEKEPDAGEGRSERRRRRRTRRSDPSLESRTSGPSRPDHAATRIGRIDWQRLSLGVRDRRLPTR